uniref:proline dehydrogenase 1, mitochondrial-like n=1 Tax=Panthera onca TaxID=9690 RepID=UPI002954E5BD
SGEYRGCWHLVCPPTKLSSGHTEESPFLRDGGWRAFLTHTCLPASLGTWASGDTGWRGPHPGQQQLLALVPQDAYDNITLDVELARREGWCFGAKLVRGAYMAQERARAAEIGYEDPINPTYEATHAMYHRCLSYVLEELKHNAKAKVMVASHNEDTVRFTLRR